MLIDRSTRFDRRHRPAAASTTRFSLLLVAVAAFGACTAAGTGTTPSPSIPAAGSPTAPAGNPDDSVGIDQPPGNDPGLITSRLVTPRPGQLDVRPIGAQTLSASVDGRRVVVTVEYASGVEPCSILDTVVVERGPGSFTITLREGHGPGEVACIEIAEFKHVVVDLGDLDPGTYRISDGTGSASPIEVTVG